MSACLLSTYRSLVTVVKFCSSVQVWLLCVRSFSRALLASLRRSEAVFAFPSFIEEDFLGAVTASKGRQIVLDSGCSASTTNYECHFVGPFSKIARTLRFLVGSVVASAEGHVQVITRGGTLRWPAICVKGSPFELLSTSYLASQGFDCLFTDAGATVFERDSGHVVATATLRNGLYFLDVLDEEVHLASTSPSPAQRIKKTSPPRHSTLRTPSPTTLQVWHNRLCHMPHRLVTSMAKHETLAGLIIATKHSDEFNCVACLKGKMTAPDLTPYGPKPLGAAIHISDSALRLAYMDIYGPLRVRGCDGSYFHMVLVLAESRKLYAYSLPDLKDGTIRKFLDLFLSRVTKETNGLSLRALRTDNFLCQVECCSPCQQRLPLGTHHPWFEPPKSC